MEREPPKLKAKTASKTKRIDEAPPHVAKKLKYDEERVEDKLKSEPDHIEDDRESDTSVDDTDLSDIDEPADLKVDEFMLSPELANKFWKQIKARDLQFKMKVCEMSKVLNMTFVLEAGKKIEKNANVDDAAIEELYDEVADEIDCTRKKKVDEDKDKYLKKWNELQRAKKDFVGHYEKKCRSLKDGRANRAQVTLDDVDISESKLAQARAIMDTLSKKHWMALYSMKA